MNYSFRPSIEASRGTLTMWNLDSVEVDFTISFEHVLIIGGCFKNSGTPFYVGNVYAPCDKKELWQCLSDFIFNQNNSNWCFCVVW